MYVNYSENDKTRHANIGIEDLKGIVLYTVNNYRYVSSG